VKGLHPEHRLEPLPHPLDRGRLAGAVAADHRDHRAAAREPLARGRAQHLASDSTGHTTRALEPHVGGARPSRERRQTRRQGTPGSQPRPDRLPRIEGATASLEQLGVEEPALAQRGRERLAVDRGLQVRELAPFARPQRAAPGEDRLRRAVLQHHPDHQQHELDLRTRDLEGSGGRRRGQERVLDRHAVVLGRVVAHHEPIVGVHVDELPRTLVEAVQMPDPLDPTARGHHRFPEAQPDQHLEEPLEIDGVDQQVEIVLTAGRAIERLGALEVAPADRLVPQSLAGAQDQLERAVARRDGCGFHLGAGARRRRSRPHQSRRAQGRSLPPERPVL
jgi:hypothetical protein